MNHDQLSTTTFDDQLHSLGVALAEDGFTPHESSVEALAFFGRLHEAAPIATAVLVDARQPEVARLRAFGLVARRLSCDAPPMILHPRLNTKVPA